MLAKIKNEINKNIQNKISTTNHLQQHNIYFKFIKLNL